jgi:hypothetical protein
MKGYAPQPEWRNWQTRQVEGLVALTGSAGSSPVSGTAKALIIQGFLRFPMVRAPFRGTIRAGIARATCDGTSKQSVVQGEQKPLVRHGERQEGFARRSWRRKPQASRQRMAPTYGRQASRNAPDAPAEAKEGESRPKARREACKRTPRLTPAGSPCLGDRQDLAYPWDGFANRPPPRTDGLQNRPTGK